MDYLDIWASETFITESVNGFVQVTLRMMLCDFVTFFLKRVFASIKSELE